jgi:uncharacterized protein (DUF1778 family)
VRWVRTNLSKALDLAYKLIAEVLASCEQLPYLPIEEITMAGHDTPDTTRGARLEVRVSVAQRGLLQRAAVLSGRTLSEFVVASAQDAARRVIAEHESIRLSREEQWAFVEALLQPPEPKARLKRAAKAYRSTGG